MTQQGYEQYLKEHNCSKCPAWSGTDCTRNPYEDGCLDPVIESYWKEHQNNLEGR